MTVRIINADVMEGLRQLPDESVHCVVCSPPYWGLRDYGVVGQIGLEPTLAEHIARMVEVFREVRRVMRMDATLWLNYGDCYATSVNGRSAADTKAAGNDDRTFRDKPFSTIGGALKPKDLCMIPHRLAIALQEDGWWVRADIVWAKPNPMPESIKDRPTKAHEYVFLLTRAERYFYDAEAIKETASYSGLANQDDSGFKDPRSFNGKHREGYRSSGELERIGSKGNAKTFRGGSYVNGEPGPRAVSGNTKPRPAGVQHKQTELGQQIGGYLGSNDTFSARNKRSVWTIATAPFPEAHFATFPPELPEICIKAGCPVGGTVLDPFSGAGTTCLVADRLQRNAIGIELNPTYAAMSERRINGDRGALLDLMEAAQ